MLARAGWDLNLVLVTDGEAAYEDISPASLARRRRMEFDVARRELGIAHASVQRLGLSDRDVAAAEGYLSTCLRRLGADLMLAPYHGDGHRDHEAAGRAARAAEPPRLLSYPVWLWHWARPGDDAALPWSRAHAVPLDADVRCAKQAALAAYTSQTHQVRPILPPDVRAHFDRDVEVLFAEDT